jgi:hypothetical protein
MHTQQHLDSLLGDTWLAELEDPQTDALVIEEEVQALIAEIVTLLTGDDAHATC